MNVYYLYGFKAGQNVMKAKPRELASVEFDGLLDAYRQAARLGYVGVFARTASLPWGQYVPGNTL